MARFTGKTVIVTGAASGMGKAAAQLFSAEGANVVALDVDQGEIDDAVLSLPADRTLAMAGDTSSQADAAAAIKAAIDRFGRLDVLINNAGIATDGDILATDQVDWDKVIAVNVTGYFHMAKAALPELIKTKGNIVQTSSVSGIGGDWNMFAYNSSKGAVTNMTRAMALDAGKHGIRANAVNPTFTDTGMTKDMQDEATIAKFVERIPMKRIGQPEDIAKVMAFLASDDAGFVTGVNLPVDGGLSASNGQPDMS